MSETPVAVDAQEAVEAAKVALKEAKDNLKKFQKGNSLKEGQAPKDETLLKKFESLNKRIEKAEAGYKTAKKAAKPKKEKSARASKYEYPADCVSKSDKKAHRTKLRNETKKANKPAKVKAEKPAKEAKVEKSAKSDSKKPKAKKVKKSDD